MALRPATVPAEPTAEAPTDQRERQLLQRKHSCHPDTIRENRLAALPVAYATPLQEVKGFLALGGFFVEKNLINYLIVFLITLSQNAIIPFISLNPKSPGTVKLQDHFPTFGIWICSLTNKDHKFWTKGFCMPRNPKLTHYFSGGVYLI